MQKNTKKANEKTIKKTESNAKNKENVPLTFPNVARWGRPGERNALLPLRSFEVEHGVTGSQPFQDQGQRWLKNNRNCKTSPFGYIDRCALGFFFVVPSTTSELHLGGEGDVVVQELAPLGERWSLMLYLYLHQNHVWLDLGVGCFLSPMIFILDHAIKPVQCIMPKLGIFLHPEK